MEEIEERTPEALERKGRAARKRLRRRQKRLALAAGVFAAAAVVALWGAQPPEFVTPSELAANPNGYAGVIQLRGVVTDVNASARTFWIGDDAVNVTVAYAALPDGFQVGKEVIAKGRVLTVSPLVFQAQEIVVGHAR